MKLKTRIVITCCTFLVVAAIIGELIILCITAKARDAAALTDGYQATVELLSDLDNYKIKNQTVVSSEDKELYYTYYNYFFKTIKDEYSICIVNLDYDEDNKKYKEIYNRTILSPEELDSMTYIKKGQLEFTKLENQGDKYLIFRSMEEYNIMVYKVINISSVDTEIREMFLYALIVTLIIAVIASIFLSLSIKKLLKPLHDFNETTRLITKDFYGHRVEVVRNDEIGELGESFNLMIDTIEARTRAIEESEMRKTLFMANLTHELKTPMTSISGYSQTLLSARLTEREKEDALLYIYNECGRLEKLSKKMMRLFEMDNEDNIELENVPVKKLFQAAIDASKVILENRNMMIEYFESGQSFNVDYDLMVDVLVNLIDNGIKASHEGSSINLIAKDNKIIVEDFGRGIPEEEINKISEPFYMVDKSRTRKSGGAGLGLALVVIIAEKHNANLIIESELNKGTKVILQFV